MKLTPEQDAAVRARGNVLVAAGAGTGKTRTLVDRCMALLESGASLDRILMVTFTDAAAVEMRSRLRRSLVSRLDAGATEGSAGLSRDQVQRQLALLETARISTLHSFCLQLVREHFHELGVDPELTVIDETQSRPVIEQLLTERFERHCAGESAEDRAVQQLVREHGSGSDERLRELVFRLHRYSQSLADPESWFAEQQRRLSDPSPTYWRQLYVEGFREWRASWRPILESFSSIAAVGVACRALDDVPEPADPGLIGAALRRIQAADEDRDQWPRGTRTRERRQLDSFYKDVEFLLSLALADGVDPLAEDWETVRPPMSALLRLAQEFTAEFNRVKRELGVADFADLEQMTLRVLRVPGGDAPSPVALQWRGQLDYVFVDEYQDINAAQDAILRALSGEGDRANRFLVGDVKQSIYRFRLANPSIFRQYEQRWADAPNSRRLPLRGNFRSRPGILNFVNALFGVVMRESCGTAYEPLECGAGLEESQRAPRVELHLVTTGDNGEADDAGGLPAERVEVADLLATEREARLVATRLRELQAAAHEIRDPADGRLRPVRWSDMAVLLRSPSGRVEAFAQEFARVGVPLETARGGFFASSEVSDLVCLLKLLDNSLQDIPLLAVLRSPLAGLTLNELASIRAAAGTEHRSESFWQSTRRYHDSGDRSASAWRKLDRFLCRLERWREVLRHSSVSHCLEIVLGETCYEVLLRAQPRGEQRTANVRRLLALARQYDPYQRQGLFRFLRFIRAQEGTDLELEAAPGTRDAVLLTSVHKSKGLEFPVVALAGLGCRFNTSDLNGTVLLDETLGLCSRVFAGGGGWHYPSLPHWLARRRQHRELLAEEARVLYVAMTRARDTLILIGTSRKRPDWTPATDPAISDHQLLSAGSHLDWLKTWVPTIIRPGEWVNDSEGANALFSWRLWDETDARLALPNVCLVSSDAVDATGDPNPAESMWNRVAWNYPRIDATRQRAKTSVSDVRRRQQEEEAAPAPFVARSGFAFPDLKPRTLSATEVGLAHHRFLQRISLATVSTVESLRTELDRMEAEGWLAAGEKDAVDLDAVLVFWRSPLGRDIQARSDAVRRELAFTARFSPAELGFGSALAGTAAAEEFIVVQGVADLAVVLPNEIWLVDFKTDSVNTAEVARKAEVYGSQLRLYSAALSRIYNRPVTRSALYFLKPRVLHSF